MSPTAASRSPHLAILGAGPTGLEAALAAAEAGHPFTLYEAGDAVAAHVRDWGHVRLFSPWDLDVSPRARTRLAREGVEVPAGDGAIWLVVVQPEGRRRMPARAWVNGVGGDVTAGPRP